MNDELIIKKPSKVKSAEALKKSREKRRKKVFVKWLKRTLVGPLLGFWLAFLGFHLMHTTLGVSVGIFLAFTAVGLFVKFKYVKYAYISLVVAIYLFLLSSLFNH